MNLVITDTSEEDQRSSRFVQLSGMTTALSAGITLVIGYYIQWRGFADLFWIALLAEVLSLVVVVFMYDRRMSHRPSADEERPLLSTSDGEANAAVSWYRTVRSVFSCRDARSRERCLNVSLILLAYIFFYVSASCLSPLLWYLLSAPFCWTSKVLGNFSAISSICSAILSVIGMKVLTYCGASDALICCVGLVCFSAYCLVVALAESSWQLYLTLFISPFSNYQSTLTFSMVSKWVDVHERSQVFTLITLINTIILDFGSSISNWIYARTVAHQKNFVFLLAAALSIIPFILYL